MDAGEGDQASGGPSGESGPMSIDDLPAYYSPAELEQLAGQISQSLEHAKAPQGTFPVHRLHVSSSRLVTTETRASVTSTPSSSILKSGSKGTIHFKSFVQ